MYLAVTAHLTRLTHVLAYCIYALGLDRNLLAMLLYLDQIPLGCCHSVMLLHLYRATVSIAEGTRCIYGSLFQSLNFFHNIHTVNYNIVVRLSFRGS